MKTMSDQARANPPSIGRRAKVALPLAAALLVHALVLIVLLSTKTPLKLQVEPATEISLIPGSATESMSTPAPQPSKPVPLAPDPKIEVAKSERAPAALGDQAPALAVRTPKPTAPASEDLQSLVRRLARSAPSLTADPVPAANPAPAITTPAQNVAGSRCQIAATLVATLQGGKEEEAALSRIPAASRSVANAIVLWDGGWIDPSSVGGSAGFGSVQRAIVSAISQAPLTCQVEVMHGVRFVILPDAKNTVILGFGSGEWRWADVAATLQIKAPE